MGTNTIAFEGRAAALKQRRRLKMAESAHAYVRGNTVKFYEWLDAVGSSGLIPEGPAVWICGDCHVGNLGPVASIDGAVEIQVRDLDQTVIGNPAHDVIRLSLSLAMAARGADLPGVTTALMLEHVALAYRQALLGRQRKTKESDVTPIRLVMQKAIKRKWRHLAEERIEDARPEIPLGAKFWQLTQAEKDEIRNLFARDDVRNLATCLKARPNNARVKVLDAAYWMKGCSSLGRLRFAVLAGIGKHNSEGFSLIDIKEATKPAAPRARDAEMPANNAERVVAGAKALSPFLGDRMLAGQFERRQVVMRELMPQDLKFELNAMTQNEAISAAGLFAGIVGKAHARQMDRKSRTVWASEFSRDRSKGLNAPSWLWTSVVDLVTSHEAAYLDHCRHYALEKAR